MRSTPSRPTAPDPRGAAARGGLAACTFLAPPGNLLPVSGSDPTLDLRVRRSRVLSVVVATLAVINAAAFVLAWRFGPLSFLLLVVALGPPLLACDAILIALTISSLRLYAHRQSSSRTPLP